MSAENSEQEPSIEEILASIRQIISDDDEEPTSESEPVPEPEPETSDDVLELTEKADEPEPEPVVEPEPVSEPEPEAEPVAAEDDFEIDLRDAEDDDVEEDDDGVESILTDSAANAALEGFAALASQAALDRKGTGATTIEDIVRELMKPMLREWLDVHLPPLIEKVVQKELQRIARKAQDKE